jgi:hypothetical protein
VETANTIIILLCFTGFPNGEQHVIGVEGEVVVDVMLKCYG